MSDDLTAAYLLGVHSAPRWIPVTEQLPPGDVRVLVVCGGGVDIATLNWKYGWHYEDYGSLEPTHWQPLPAPPEAEQ